MYLKPYEELRFTDDFLFCNVLTRSPELTKQLLELILQVPIRAVQESLPQKSVQIAFDAHGIRFDVYVADDKKTIYDIEMQTTGEKDLGLRMRYYQGMMDLSLLSKGQSYSALRKSYIIFICLEKPRAFSENLPLYTFCTACQEDGSVELNDHAFKIVLNAAGPMESLSPEMRSFFGYLRSGKPEDIFTRKLEEKTSEVRQTREVRAAYMTLQMKLDEAKREGLKEGEDIGRRKGLLEGHKKGLAEGHKEGLAEGHKEAHELYVRTLMQKLALSREEAEKLLL